MHHQRFVYSLSAGRTVRLVPLCQTCYATDPYHSFPIFGEFIDELKKYEPNDAIYHVTVECGGNRPGDRYQNAGIAYTTPADLKKAIRFNVLT